MAKRKRIAESFGGDEGPKAFAEAALDEPPPSSRDADDLQQTEFLIHSAPEPLAEPVTRNGARDDAALGDASLAEPAAVPVAKPAAPEAPLSPLELRVRRLEDALAQLQQSRGSETRVTAQPPPTAIPMATPAHQAPTDKLWELGKKVLSAPVEAARKLSGDTPAARARRAWLLVESLTEARAIVRMFVDPRYSLSWTGKIVPPVLTALIVSSWWWVPGTSIPIFGTILDKAVDLVLAFVLFKLLGYEARRYRETAPDLPPSLRL